MRIYKGGVKEMKSMEELRDDLTLAIDKYRANKRVIKYMQDVYKEKNLPLMTVGTTFLGQKALSDMDDLEVGIWCYYLHEVTQDEDINPEIYLTDGEIYKVKTFINMDELNIKTDKIVLHNVIKKVVKGRLSYSCPDVSFYDIYKAQKNSLVVYNFETQREATIKQNKGRMYRRETVNQASVDEIANLVEQDELESSMITWNIRQTPYWRENVIYDEDTKTLTLMPSFEKEIFIDNIDGYHRTLGITKAVHNKLQMNDLSLEGYMLVTIRTFTVDKAQDYIYTQNKQNAIKKEHVESFAKNDINDFVKELNYYGGGTNVNMMYDKITSIHEEIDGISKYVTIAILSDAFRLSKLKFNKPRKLERHLKYFTDVFNTVLGYFDEKYDEDEKKMRKESVVLEPNAFVGYIAMGIAVYEENNPIDKLNEVLESGIIDLNRKAYDWESIDIFRKNPKSYKKIYDYFYDIVKENIK